MKCKGFMCKVVFILYIINVLYVKTTYSQTDSVMVLNRFENNEYKKLINQIDSLNNLAEINFSQALGSGHENALDALKLSVRSGDKNRITLSYLNYASSLRLMGKYKQALDTLYSTIPMLGHISDKKLIVAVLNAIGMCHIDLGHDTLSMDEYLHSLPGIEKNSRKIACLLDQLSDLYFVSGIYSKATEFYTKGLKFHQLNQDSLKIAFIYTRLGQIAGLLNKKEEALANYEMAVSFFPANYRGRLLYHALCETGILYFSTSQSEKALIQLNKVIEKSSENENPDILIKALLYKAVIQKLTTDIHNVEVLFNHAKSLAVKHKKDTLFVQVCYETGNMYFEHRQWGKAYKSFLESFHAAMNLKMAESESDILKRLIMVEERRGNMASAQAFSKYYIKMTDSLIQSYSQQLISINEKHYTHQSRESRIETLNRERKWQRLVSEKTKLENRLLMVAVGALIIILILIWRLYFLRTRNNRLLKIKSEKILVRNQKLRQVNEELNNINDQLIKSEEALRQANEAKNILFSIVAHDLKNPVTNLRSLVFIIKNIMKEHQLNENESYFIELERTLNTTAGLMNNLLNWALASQEKIVPTFEQIAFKELINQAVALFEISLVTKNLLVEVNIPDEMEVSGDREMLNLVIRNLLSNAVKYSYPGGIIKIHACFNGNEWEVSVADSGVGMDETTINELHVSRLHKSMAGTANEKGCGIGMMLVYEFVKKLHGNLHIVSQPGQGSVFRIIFALN